MVRASFFFYHTEVLPRGTQGNISIALITGVSITAELLALLALLIVIKKKSVYKINVMK